MDRESEEVNFFPPCCGRETVGWFYGDTDSLLIGKEAKERTAVEDWQ